MVNMNINTNINFNINRTTECKRRSNNLYSIEVLSTGQKSKMKYEGTEMTIS